MQLGAFAPSVANMILRDRFCFGRLYMDHQEGLFKAIRHFGSQRALADAIGVKKRCVSSWLNREKRIPYQYAVTIFYLTNGRISLNELAPENYKINRRIENGLRLELEEARNDEAVILS